MVLYTLDSGNQIKLGDLGISKKILEDKNSKAKFTLIGTLVYMSPEIIQDKEYSYNTDIW
jgi:serine/threonine protein kinase